MRSGSGSEDGELGYSSRPGGSGIGCTCRSGHGGFLFWVLLFGDGVARGSGWFSAHESLPVIKAVFRVGDFAIVKGVC